MPKKLGGLVCDNDACRIFYDYGYGVAGLNNWIIVPFKRDHTFYYCSKKCETRHGYEGRKRDSDEDKDLSDAEKCL